VPCAGVPRHIESGNAEPSASSSHADHVFEDYIRLLRRAALVYSLVSDGVDRTVHHAAVLLDDLVNRVAFGEFDGNASDLLCGLEPLGYAINDIFGLDLRYWDTSVEESNDPAKLTSARVVIGLKAAF